MSGDPSLLTDETRTPTPPGATRRAVVIGVTAIGAIATYFVARAHLEESAARALSIFVVGALFWATEALPLFATALLVVALQVVFLATDGGLATQWSGITERLGLDVGPVRDVKASVFFAPFASDTIMLFLGGFMLAAAIVKHGVDRAAASKMLGPFTRSPGMLIAGVLGVAAFFSMWMSNTACAAMMMAIVHPLARRAGPGSRLPTALVLAAAFGANVGGVGTPIGTPPNAIAFAALHRAGYAISFIEWMIFAVPLMVAMLAVTWIVLTRAFPGAPGERIEPVDAHGSIGRRGWMTIAIALITVAMWLTGERHHITPGAVALLSGAALAAFGLLGREDVDSIDWNILILMWGGLSISEAMTRTGLGDAIAALPVDRLGGPVVLGAALAVLAAGLSTFMSNTAAAGLLVPMALAFGVAGREQLAVVAALATSFAMALPVSTPPNAIAYATGWAPIRWMAKAGIWVTMIGVGATALGFRWIIPMVIGPASPAP